MPAGKWPLRWAERFVKQTARPGSEEPTMPRRTARAGASAFALALVLLAGTPAAAVITALTPLSGMLQESQFVLTATVERLDADKPAVVLTVEEGLKGKAPFRKLAVN